MKRSERHRLKENEISEIFRETVEKFSESGRGLKAAVVAILVVLVGGGGFWGWRARTEGQARAMLGEALAITASPIAPPPAPAANGTTPAAPTPPPPSSYASAPARDQAALAKFVEVATNYPSSKAAVVARYHAASILVTLGRIPDASTRFQEVVDRDGDGFYGRMAQLGLIDAEVRQGQYDRAIAQYRELVNKKDDRLPLDAVLLQLGRTYAAAGKPNEARQTFDQLLKEYPDSDYLADAKREIAYLSNPS